MTISIENLRLAMKVSAVDHKGAPLKGEGLSVGVIEGYRVNGSVEGVFGSIEHDQNADMVQVRFDYHGESEIVSAQLFLESVFVLRT
jgi:hypothetical protein